MCYHNYRPVWLPLQQHSRSLEGLLLFPKWISQILSRTLAALFALVGFLVGGVAGACTLSSGSENGVVRRASLGALAGTVFALRVLVESQLFREFEFRNSSASIPTLSDSLQDFLSGAFIEDVIFPTEHFMNERSYDVHDTPSNSIVSGIPQEVLDGLSCYKVSQHEMGCLTKESTCCCPICLEEFKVGDIARALPFCNHNFHSNCIDQWLIKHAICPICRHCIL